MDSIKIGSCIKRNREKLCLSIEDLSAMSGISISVLEAYESGKQKLTAKELTQIAQTLNIPLMVLVHGGGLVETLTRDPKRGSICHWKEY